MNEGGVNANKTSSTQQIPLQTNTQKITSQQKTNVLGRTWEKLGKGWNKLGTGQKVAVVATAIFAGILGGGVGGLVLSFGLAKVFSKYNTSKSKTTWKLNTVSTKTLPKNDKTEKKSETKPPSTQVKDLKTDMPKTQGTSSTSKPPAERPSEEFMSSIEALNPGNVKQYIDTTLSGHNISGLTPTMIDNYKKLATSDRPTYDNHIVLLAQSHPELAATILCQTVSVKSMKNIPEQLANNIPSGNLAKMIKTTLRLHIQVGKETQQALLREDSFTSTLVSAFAKKHLKGEMQKFMGKVMEDIPKKLIEDKKNKGFDPVGLKKLEVVGTSLLFKLNDFLKNEDNNKEIKLFKEICQDTEEVIGKNEKYKGVGIGIAGDHLFLRALNPMLSSPEGIKNENQIENCKLLGKMMQNLKNGVTPGTKQSHHKVLVGWQNNNEKMLTEINNNLFGKNVFNQLIEKQGKDWRPAPEDVFQNKDLLPYFKIFVREKQHTDTWGFVKGAYDLKNILMKKTGELGEKENEALKEFQKKWSNDSINLTGPEKQQLKKMGNSREDAQSFLNIILGGEKLVEFHPMWQNSFIREFKNQKF